MGVTEEVGKAASGFVNVMGGQPLALALVIMYFVLLGFLFYTASSTNTQRHETVDLIVKWQQETDKLMVNCVSAEVSRSMMDNMQKITETMLNAEQKEIQRMQGAINDERNRSWELRQREQMELDELKRQQQPTEAPPRMQRMSGHSAFFPLPPLPDIPVLRATPQVDAHD
jgi:hypothetical protein